jgi:hypothetical protein
MWVAENQGTKKGYDRGRNTLTISFILSYEKQIKYLFKCERLNVELKSMLTITLLMEYWFPGYHTPSTQCFGIDIVY